MSHAVFNSHANDYDAWYDSETGKAIFATEVVCLKPFLSHCCHPYLEIGTGSGRFAQALGIECSVEPAHELALIAKSRGVKVSETTGEKLPFPEEMFGAVLMAFTLCFLDNPQKVLREAWRVLKPEGGLVLGLILRDSPWADLYARKGREGHPIYSQARFFSKDEIEDLIIQSGFEMQDYRSTLFQPPGQTSYRVESPVPGYRKSAGFVSLIASKETK